MTYACMECGEDLPQYKAGYCARCIADEEAHEYEAEDAEEGRDAMEAEPEPERPVTIPKDMAKLVLTELSPQWHTKAVRELLRTIEEQL